jgi:hypothetical protein
MRDKIANPAEFQILKIQIKKIYKGVTLTLKPLAISLSLLENGEGKGITIYIVPEDFPAFDSPRYDMVQRTCSIYSGFSWHICSN